MQHIWKLSAHSLSSLVRWESLNRVFLLSHRGEHEQFFCHYHKSWEFPTFGEIASVSTSIMQVAAFPWKNMDQMKWSSGESSRWAGAGTYDCEKSVRELSMLSLEKGRLRFIHGKKFASEDRQGSGAGCPMRLCRLHPWERSGPSCWAAWSDPRSSRAVSRGLHWRWHWDWLSASNIQVVSEF